MPKKQFRPKRANTQGRPGKGRPAIDDGRPVKAEQSAKGRPQSVGKAATVNYVELLKPLISTPIKPQPAVVLQSSPLAHLNYSKELEIKNQAFDEFWQHYKLPGVPEPLTASPRPRRYRTTSKRKTVMRGGNLDLLFNDASLRLQKKPFVDSPLEPKAHSRIFEFLQAKISEPAFKLIGRHLNYLIIRGTYVEHAVIFNVDTLNGPLVRKLKIVAEHLRKLFGSIIAAFIYTAPGGSEYYLEERQAANILHFKKLFGRANLMVSHLGRRYAFHPTSFSQVNESMVPHMLKMTKEMLAPKADEQLLDLYCGYGLFSHYLAPDYSKVLGIDFAGPSIQAAIANKKSTPCTKNSRFAGRRITQKSVEKIALPGARMKESILLDPPRQGPQDGVIEALAARSAAKVLHIHCGVDEIPSSIKEWTKYGYRLERIVPLDMFPGSANLEVLILLTANQVSNK